MAGLAEDENSPLEIGDSIEEKILTLVHACKDIELDNLVFHDPLNGNVKFALFRDGLTWILIASKFLPDSFSQIQEDVYIFECTESEVGFKYLFSQVYEEGKTDLFSFSGILSA
ncbi:hypothetical protein REC12_26350 [Desulfosporosinus sp. PR]|uniref:hypothetical protein n=1 Tax=Candidatus Desulfosporosinus nitrosoreducens TaxID=3401928 RepID=UPI0027F3B15E|nr:hypothetical protein [Desulfosporosinus sp. PR]MDQ7097123.1 hypothetical protein [Desulfosporosinus sp. PR]